MIANLERFLSEGCVADFQQISPSSGLVQKYYADREDSDIDRLAPQNHTLPARKCLRNESVFHRHSSALTFSQSASNLPLQSIPCARIALMTKVVASASQGRLRYEDSTAKKSNSTREPSIWQTVLHRRFNRFSLRMHQHDQAWAES